MSDEIGPEDRPQADEDLRESDDDAQRMLDHLLVDLPGVVYRCRNDEDWTTIGVTPNVEELTGYPPSALVRDGDLEFGDLIHPGDRERVWKTVQGAVDRDEAFRITYRIRTRSGEERWVLEQGRAVEDRKTGEVVLTGYIQDLTEPVGGMLSEQQKELDESRRQRRLIELLQTVTSIVNEHRSLETALRSAVPEICSALGFEVGHVFLSEPHGGGGLRSTDIWHLEAAGVEAFREATESHEWRVGEGLPGRVMESGAPEWIEDVKEDPTFFRVEEDDPPPIRSGLGTPIVSGTRLLGVLEIYSVERKSPQPDVEAIFSQIGVQLGRVWEREEAARHQRLSERRFQQLAANAAAVFVLTDLDGDVLYVSPGFEKVTGRAEAPDNWRNLLEIVHPEDRDRIDRLFSDQKRAPYRVEFRVVQPDGTARWIRHRSFPIENDRGEVYRIGGLAEDVTAERQARTELERTTRLLEQTISSLEEAVLVVGTEERGGVIVEANEAAETIFGYRRDELVGEDTEKLHVDGGAHERFGAEGECALKTEGVFHASYPLKRRDGTVFQAEQTVTLLDPSRGPTGGVVTVVRDISDQAEAEARLRESEARFRQIAERIDDVFWISSPDKKKMEYVSPAYRKVWGREPEELYRDPGAWLRSIHPEDRERIRAALPTQAEGRYEKEYRVVRPDGEIRWIWDRAFPVEDEDGVVKRVVGVAEDVTDRKELEWQLVQAQKMEAVGRLAGGIAHDFNNILTVISAQSDLLLQDLDGSTPMREEVELIRTSAERAARLTNQLLAFSREQVLRPRVVDLNETIDGMEQLLRRVLGEDIRIEVRLDDSLPPIRVDVSQLEQVILNLAVNAREAMPDGGVLEISTTRETLTEAEAAEKRGLWPGPNVCLRISDTGVGMDEETRSRVFEPFFTTKRKEGGTGLGLAVSYGIVKQSGGSIHLDSDPGAGTTFEIRFPPADDEVPGVEGAGRSGDAAGSRRGSATVLAIEDDPSVQRVVRRILERAGMEVKLAADAETGLTILDDFSETIQVVLTDLVLPGMSGRELLEEIQARDLDVPVIVMSGYDHDSPSGAGDPGDPGDLPPEVLFIQKPFTAEDLLQGLRTVLEGGSREGV